MLYTIKRLNRTVNLDDDLVDKYCQYDILRDQPFSIIVRSKYGHCPTQEELSDEDLSIICNDVLLAELKTLALLPEAMSVIKQNYDTLYKQTQEGKLVEYKIYSS